MNQEYKFEKKDCIFCKTDKFTKNLLIAPDRINNVPGEFYLAKCKKCGFVFQNPRVKEEFISEYYPDETGYYQPYKKTEKHLKEKVEESILINFFEYGNPAKKNVFEKIILYPIYLFFYKAKSFPIFVPGGKLLDIGCSHGVQLEQMKRIGWDVEGIEPNKKAANYAANVRGLKVKTGNFPQDLNFPDNYFDVIIMQMVLEHLHRPIESIQKISAALKSGGQLIFSIPYFNGLEFKIFGRFSYSLHLPAHINFFNKKNIRTLLSENFSDIKFNFQGVDRDFVAPFAYLEKEKDCKYLRKIITNKVFRLIIIKPVISILSILGLTSRVTVRAIKK